MRDEGGGVSDPDLGVLRPVDAPEHPLGQVDALNDVGLWRGQRYYR